MKEINKFELISTKWGPAIDFNGELAFLDLDYDRKSYPIGNQYYCEIYYTVMISTTPDGANKNWLTLKSNTIENLLILQEETALKILKDDLRKKRVNQKTLKDNKKYFESKKTIGIWFKIIK